MKKVGAEELKKRELKGKGGICREGVGLYEGKKLYLLLMKSYREVGMVGGGG